MGVSGFTVHGIQQHVRMQMIRMYPRSKTKNGGTNSEGRTVDAIVNQEQQRKSVHLRRSTATSRNGQSAPQAGVAILSIQLQACWYINKYIQRFWLSNNVRSHRYGLVTSNYLLYVVCVIGVNAVCP